MSKKKALHIFHGLNPSGMERMLVSSADYWCENEYALIAICQGEDHPYAQVFEEKNIQIERTRNLRSLSGLFDYTQKLKLHRPDIVHIHVESMHGPIALLTRFVLPRTRIFRTIHSVFQFHGLSRITRTVQILLFILVGGVQVSPSDDVQENELRFWGFNSVVVENWVDDSYSTHKAEKRSLNEATHRDQVELILVGNCSAIKSHEIVLDAATSVPNIRINHVGSDVRSTLQEKTLKNQLSESGQLIDFGQLSDPKHLFLLADIYAMPSRIEGQAVALAEALCLGVPALISDSIGFGWAKNLPGVVTVQDDEWLEILLRITESTPELNELTIAALANQELIQQRFSALRGVKDYLDVYETESTWIKKINSQLRLSVRAGKT